MVNIMNVQTSEITSDVLGAVVDGLDLDNELFGSTESDDGVDVLKTTNQLADDTTDTNEPVVTDKVAEPIVSAPPSKAAIARGIFVDHYNVKQRKDIIVLFEQVAGCTEKGAATYYQNFTKEVKDGKLTVKHPTKVVADPVV